MSDNEIHVGDKVTYLQDTVPYHVLALTDTHAWIVDGAGYPHTIVRASLRVVPKVFEVGTSYRETMMAHGRAYTVRAVLPDGRAVATYDDDDHAVVLTRRSNYDEVEGEQ